MLSPCPFDTSHSIHQTYIVHLQEARVDLLSPLDTLHWRRYLLYKLPSYYQWAILLKRRYHHTLIGISLYTYKYGSIIPEEQNIFVVGRERQEQENNLVEKKCFLVA